MYKKFVRTIGLSDESRRRIVVQGNAAKEIFAKPSCLGVAADWPRVGRRALGLVAVCFLSNFAFWLPPQVAHR